MNQTYTHKQFKSLFYFKMDQEDPEENIKNIYFGAKKRLVTTCQKINLKDNPQNIKFYMNRLMSEVKENTIKLKKQIFANSQNHFSYLDLLQNDKCQYKQLYKMFSQKAKNVQNISSSILATDMLSNRREQTDKIQNLKDRIINQRIQAQNNQEEKQTKLQQQLTKLQIQLNAKIAKMESLKSLLKLTYQVNLLKYQLNIPLIYLSLDLKQKGLQINKNYIQYQYKSAYVNSSKKVKCQTNQGIQFFLTRALSYKYKVGYYEPSELKQEYHQLGLQNRKFQIVYLYQKHQHILKYLITLIETNSNKLQADFQILQTSLYYQKEGQRGKIILQQISNEQFYQIIDQEKQQKSVKQLQANKYDRFKVKCVLRKKVSIAQTNEMIDQQDETCSKNQTQARSNMQPQTYTKYIKILSCPVQNIKYINTKKRDCTKSKSLLLADLSTTQNLAQSQIEKNLELINNFWKSKNNNQSII